MLKITPAQKSTPPLVVAVLINMSFGHSSLNFCQRRQNIYLTEWLTRSILDDKDFQNDLYPAVFKEMNLAYLRKFGQMFAETKFKLSNCETFMKYKHSPATFSSQGTDFYTVHTVKTKFFLLLPCQWVWLKMFMYIFCERVKQNEIYACLNKVTPPRPRQRLFIYET